MRVNIVRDPMRFGFSVYIWQEGEGATAYLKQFGTDGETLWVPVDQTQSSEDMRPSLFIAEDELRALVDAATGVLPEAVGTVGHLRDAQGVRDRLLTLVERLVSQPEPQGVGHNKKEQQGCL